MKKYIIMFIPLLLITTISYANSTDWNKVIKEAIEIKIQERTKTCKTTWTTTQCEAKSRIAVEMDVWAEVLAKNFVVVKAWHEDGFLWVTIKRGGEIPLIGDLKLGKFDNIEDVFVVDNKVKVIYKSQAAINQEQKLIWGGGGFLSGILLIAVFLVIL